MVNLDQICKVEVMGDYYRLYLVSGDVEEVDKKTFMSAIQSSGSQFMTYTEEPEVASFDNIDNDDVEDITDLSDGTLVADEDLAEPIRNNATVEGSEEVGITAEEIAHVIRILKTQNVTLS